MLFHLYIEQTFTLRGERPRPWVNFGISPPKELKCWGLTARQNSGASYASDVLILLKMVFRPALRLLIATIEPRAIKAMIRAYSTRS
jgi:hypothetical protein